MYWKKSKLILITLHKAKGGDVQKQRPLRRKILPKILPKYICDHDDVPKDSSKVYYR